MVWRGQGLIQGAGVKGGLMQGGKMGWVLGRVMQRGTMTGIWPGHLVRGNTEQVVLEDYFEDFLEDC
jgi:hypothetical protein